MALLRKSELKNMNEQAMAEKLKELKKEMIKVNMQRASGTTLESPGRSKQIKKTIARIYTVLHQKKMKPAEKTAQQPKGGSEKNNERLS